MLKIPYISLVEFAEDITEVSFMKEKFVDNEKLLRYKNETNGYPNDKVTEEKEEILDVISPSASVTDCTGLIPFAAKNETQLEAYREIIDYTAPIKPDK